MFCPACGAQNPDNAGSCSACAKPLPSAGINVAPPPPPPLSPENSPAAAAPAPARVYPPLSSVSVASGYPPALSMPQPQKTMSIFGMIGIGIAILLALVYAVAAPVPALPNEAQALGYRFGTILAALGFSFLIAYPIAGRRKARNPNLFAGLFCGITLFILLANAMSNPGLLQPENSEQKAARLMREAAGIQPVRRSIFGENKTDTKTRDLFKDILALNKEYQDAESKLDTSEVKNLSTPESFANPDSVAGALQQLHAAYDVDAHQEERMGEILENFKHSLDDLPASERQEMLDGFSQGLGRVTPTRQRALSSEKAWIDSLDDVYGYAGSHHSDFVIADGHVGINDDQVREEFNTRIHTMNARREEFLQAKHDLDQMQSQSLQKIGLNPQQVGLH